MQPISRRPRTGVPMRIAIVGTGIAGMVAAHRLHREHEITVYEAGPYIGGHTNTIRVESEEGTDWIDTGFIVFNDRNYPNFEALLAELGVAVQPSSPRSRTSLGRASCLRPRQGRGRTRVERRTRQDPPRLPADGDGPGLRLPRHRTGRAPRDPHRVPSTGG